MLSCVIYEWCLIATDDKRLLYEVTQFFSKYFVTNDMGETSYVVGKMIHKDISKYILGLSQESYINKILEDFDWIIVHQI